MSFWWEVWTRPGDASFGRLLEDLEFNNASYHEGLNQVGDGTAALPFGFNQALLLDPSIPAGSLLRLIHSSNPDYPVGEWLTTQITPETDATDPTIEVAGVGMNSTLAYARLEPFDWDGSDDFTSRDPDWIYGGNDFAVNGGLEDHPFAIPNVGFEDGTIVPWWRGPAAQAFVQTTVVDTGTYAMQINPQVEEGGASTTFPVVPNKTYTVTLRVRRAAGTQFQVGCSGPDAIQAIAPATVVINTWDGSYAGGHDREAQLTIAGTGAFETVVLSFTAAPNQTWTQLSVRDEGGDPDPIYVDVVTVTGYGTGASPWEATHTSRVTTFEVSNAQAFTGTWSLEVTAATNHGALQNFKNILPGVTYTASVAVGHADAASLWALEVRDVQGNLIAQDEATIGTAAWTELEVTFRVPDFLPGADGALTVAVINYDSATRTAYIDDLVFYQGNPPATIGQILVDIYNDATVNHPGRVVWEDFANPGNPWLVLDFDGTNDSAGNPWAAPVEVRLPMRASYSQIMADLSRQFGVEYRVIRDPAQDGRWLWQVYQSGTMGTDLSAAPNVAVLSGTTEVMRGVAVRLPSATDVMVEGPDKITARDRDAGLIAGLGRIEASVWSPNAETPAEEADEYLDTVQTRLESYRVTLVDPDVVPFVDYRVGDIVWVEDPPISQAFRVVDIIAVFGPETNRFNVQFGSVFATGEAAMAQAVAGLMPADPVHRPQGAFQPSPDRTITAGSDRLVQVIGGTGMPTLVVAGDTATPEDIARADIYIPSGVDARPILQPILDTWGTTGGVLVVIGYLNVTIDPVRNIGLYVPGTIQGWGVNSGVSAMDTTAGTVVQAKRAHNLEIGASFGVATQTALGITSSGQVTGCELVHPLNTALRIAGGVRVSDCLFNGQIHVTQNSCVITGNTWQPGSSGPMVDVSYIGAVGEFSTVITGNNYHATSDNVPYVIRVRAGNVVVSGNHIRAIADHIIDADTVGGLVVTGNSFYLQASPGNSHLINLDACEAAILSNWFYSDTPDDARDIIHVTGGSANCRIQGNTIHAIDHRSAVNVDSATDTVILSNTFSGSYDTAPIIDSGTNTQDSFAGGVGDNLAF